MVCLWLVEARLRVKVDPGPVEGAGTGNALQTLSFQRAVGGQPTGDVPGGAGFIVDQFVALQAEGQDLVAYLANVSVEVIVAGPDHDRYRAYSIVDHPGRFDITIIVGHDIVGQDQAYDEVGVEFLGKTDALVVVSHGQGIGMFGFPTTPGGNLGGQQEQLCAFVWTINGATPGLGPDRFRRVVPPGHSIHHQATGVAEDVGLSINSPVVHETGVANRSPRDQRGYAGHFVIDHLPKTQDGDGIGFGLPFQADANDKFVVV